MKILCPQCHIERNPEEAPECPICKFGKPKKEGRHEYHLKEKPPAKKDGPKSKVYTCPKCGYRGTLVRNPKGHSSNCAACGKRYY